MIIFYAYMQLLIMQLVATPLGTGDLLPYYLARAIRRRLLNLRRIVNQPGAGMCVWPILLLTGS